MPYFGSLLFFLYFAYFVCAGFLAWYIPGNVLLRFISFPKFEKHVLSILVGIVFWGWQGFLFGYLHIRFATYLYLLLFFVLFLKDIKYMNISFKKVTIDWILVGIITVGMLLQLSGVFFMGAKFPSGIMLCCGHIPDNNLELSIVNEIVQRFPPFEPGMFGHPLENYHYWGHLVFAELIRVFRLPLVATVYQYGTVFYSLLFGLVLIVTSLVLGMKKTFTRWLLFFAYFGGDSAFLISLFQGKGFGLPIGAMEHGAQLLLNYPRAISIILFLAGFCLFLQWVKDKKLFTGIIMACVFGSIIGFKVYTGIFVLIGCISYGLFLLYKRQLKHVFPLILVGFFSALIYLPVNTKAGGLFYTGFWRVNDFIVLPGLQLSRLELAREIYERGGSYLHAFLYELLFMFLYIGITFGTKIIGVFQTRKSLQAFPAAAHIFLIPGFIMSFVVGMFFWQKIGGPNTFNFIVTILIVGCFYTALASDYWLSKFPRISRIMVIVLLILATIPRVLFSVGSGIVDLKHAQIITPKELPALSYLKDNTPQDAIYLADPAYYPEYVSPYIPYMTQRRSFLSGIIDELEAHGIEHAERLALAQEVFMSSDSARVEKILRDNNISYLYLTSTSKLPVATISSRLRVVFDNGDKKIFKVTFDR